MIDTLPGSDFHFIHPGTVENRAVTPKKWPGTEFYGGRAILKPERYKKITRRPK
jgi:hypothetical protein